MPGEELRNSSLICDGSAITQVIFAKHSKRQGLLVLRRSRWRILIIATQCSAKSPKLHELTSAGCMLRVSPKQLRHPNQIERVVKMLEIPANQIHFLLDYGTSSMTLEIDMPYIPTIMNWKSLTTAAGAFPRSLTTLPENQLHPIKRSDWTTWLAARVCGKRIPDFGDYTVKDPGAPSGGGDPPVVLRYTVGNQWAILKKGRLTKGGAKGMPLLCKTLASTKAFRGKGFSAGDLAISNIAERITPNTGGDCEWLQWAISHHLESVVEQLLKLRGT